MKNNYGINKSQVIEGWMLDPHERDITDMFPGDYGWRVILVVGYDANGNRVKLTIKRADKKQCIELLTELGLYFIENYN